MDSNSLLSGLNLDSKGFKQLLDAQSLVDCTLACDGGTIAAHKVVLSACSNYLAKILIEHPVEHPIIILPELNIEDVRTLIHYMYTGELLKSNTLHSSSLLKTAAILSVNSLNDFFNGTTNNSNNSSNNNNSNISSSNNNISNINTIDNSNNNNNINNYFGNNTNNTNANGSAKSEFQFKCPVCQNDFQTICSFEYHMQRVHNVTSFQCEICHKPFASLRYVLTDHMRRCHGWKPEQKLQC